MNGYRPSPSKEKKKVYILPSASRISGFSIDFCFVFCFIMYTNFGPISQEETLQKIYSKFQMIVVFLFEKTELTFPSSYLPKVILNLILFSLDESWMDMCCPGQV